MFPGLDHFDFYRDYNEGGFDADFKSKEWRKLGLVTLPVFARKLNRIVSGGIGRWH